MTELRIQDSEQDQHATDEEVAVNLRAAIADAQQIIRAFDAKAQILAAFLAVMLGAVHLAMTTPLPAPWISLCGHVSMITALLGILIIGAVLFPRSDPHTSVELKEYIPTRVFYPVSDRAPDFTLQTYVSQLRATRWLWELSFEMLKLVSLRKRKRLLFQWALAMSAITVLLSSVPLVI